MFSTLQLLIQKLYLASDEAFEKTWCIAPQIWDVHRVQLSSESFVDSSRAGIVKRHVRRVPCISLNLPGSSRLQSSIQFGIVCKKTLTLKLHYSSVKLVVLFVEINEN